MGNVTTSYATYDNLDSYSYNCIKYLMGNDEVVWKLLKYTSQDAWNKPDLTQEEKAAMIYDGSDDSSKFKVFLDMGSPDVLTREDCLIRISPHSIFPENRVYGTANMIFEVYCNYYCNTLSNYKTRVDMITQRFLQVFNGKEIDGLVGKLYFDRLASESNRMEWGGQSPWRGRWIIFSGKTT